MPYFPVSDDAAFHPKMVAAGNAAVGLWTRAGAWCKDHVSGGFVPASIATALGTRSQIEKLLTVGLWDRADGGYRFHDWEDQAGNFDADTERKRRDNERERAKLRKRNQRARENGDGHGVTPDVTWGGVTPPVTDMSRTPPSPSPVNQLPETSPVGNRESYPQGPDEGESIEALCARQARTLGVDFTKVKTEIGKACGRFPDPTAVMRIIAAVLARATPPVKSPTGVCITAVRNDWAEWQQFLDEAAAS